MEIATVEDGGRELIRIIDDGAGIGVEDLGLAFASHATSKLTCDEDLFRIGTMGFRGEALASIGAVSHARICSRVAEARGECAYEVTNRGGAISDPSQPRVAPLTGLIGAGGLLLVPTDTQLVAFGDPTVAAEHPDTVRLQGPLDLRHRETGSRAVGRGNDEPIRRPSAG